MKKQVLIPALLIGTILTASVAMAAPGMGKFRNGNGDCSGQGRSAMTFEQHEERVELRLDKMAAVLDLTDAQQAQIKELLNQNWQQRQTEREGMQSARDGMRAARTAEVFDEADFRAKVGKMNELKTERMVEQAKQKAEIFALLTPEQQQKAETLHGLMGGAGGGKGHQGDHRFCL